MPAKTLLNGLLDKNVLFLNNDLNESLRKKKVPELKHILKSYDLKLSGKKDDLINRIKENQSEIDIEVLNLEPVLYVSNDYQDFYNSTDFIEYGHNSNYISIFELFKYYQSSPGKNKDEIILGTMIEKYKIKLDEVNKHDSKMLSSRISDYYLKELNNIYDGYYYLNCSVMIQIMQNIESYRGMLVKYGKNSIQIDNLDYLFRIHDKNIQTYNKLFHTSQLNSVNVVKDMYSHTDYLPYSDEDRKLVSNFVFHYFKDQEESERILRHEIENEYYPNPEEENHNNTNQVNKIDTVESGFKRFIKNIFK